VPEKKSDSYILIYAAAICMAASVLLAAASAGLRQRQNRMAELDRKFNVLKAFQIDLADDAGRRIADAEIERLYAAHVRETIVDAASGEAMPDRTSADIPPADLAAGRALQLFHWVENGESTKYAFPVSGKGLWSTIYGYLAVDRTLSEIIGITFYRHGETPGLGGEIEQPWFQEQFKGRRLFDGGEPRPVVVAKGKAPPDAAADPARVVVDGISGATLTGNGVTGFLTDAARRYAAHFNLLRRG